MRRVEWVLFDLGGVLVNVDQSRIFEGLAQKTGLETGHIRDMLLRGIPLDTEFIVTEYLPSHLTKEVNRALGADLSEADVIAAVNAELGETIQTTAELLPELRRRVNVGCLSNTNSIHWDRLLGAYPFMHHFDRRFASQLVGHAKPGREIYQIVADRLSVRPDQILFFDDKEENIRTAQHLGWHAVVYRDHVGLTSALRDFGLLP
jgi:epoxide hydrolase-like predicted phosphatase